MAWLRNEGKAPGPVPAPTFTRSQVWKQLAWAAYKVKHRQRKLRRKKNTTLT